jgi:hypothetical protein
VVHRLRYPIATVVINALAVITIDARSKVLRLSWGRSSAVFPGRRRGLPFPVRLCSTFSYLTGSTECVGWKWSDS